MRKSYTAQFKAKVALEAVKGDRSLAELASRYAVHSTQIGQWRQALLSGLPDIFSDRRRRRQEDDAAQESRLYEEIGRLKVDLDWLKKELSGLGPDGLRPLVEPDHEVLSIGRQCELLGLSRSAYYYRPVGVSAEDLRRMRIIDEVFTKRPYYGARRLRDALNAGGDDVGREHVGTLMRLMGLEAIYPKKRLSVPEKAHRVYPYLLRGLAIERPDQVWCSDITYIRLKQGFAYLVAVMDWYSRYVLSWELSLSLESGFCVSALRDALDVSHPEIFNSDQGSQYTSEAFMRELLERAIRISMDGRGRAFDNIMIERLWRTVKYEKVFLKDYAHFFAARESLAEYFAFYNEERRHWSLNNQTPSSAYWTGRVRARRVG